MEFGVDMSTDEYLNRLIRYSREVDDEEGSECEQNRPIDEVSEVFNRYVNEKIWHEYRRCASEFRNAQQCTREPEELDAGDEEKISEFLNEFMIRELSEV